ncbi:hypothetical protein [Mycobacterium syngnathidarum]
MIDTPPRHARHRLIDTYEANEKADQERARQNRVAAIRQRWLFGRKLLAEREVNGGKQLPPGRLNELIEQTGKSRQELQYRMRFAERFPSSGDLANVLAKYSVGCSTRAAMETPQLNPHNRIRVT